MALSKSQFMLSLKHPAWLWLQVHEPDRLPPHDDNTLSLFASGNLFEEYAEQRFTDAIKLGYKDERGHFDGERYRALPELTKEALSGEQTVILQGRLEIDGLTCIFDVLERTPMGTFNLYEIKSSTSAKPEHEHDLAFQTIVLEKAGLTIDRMFVIHVNNEYVRQGEIDIKQIADETEVTSAVRSILEDTKRAIEEAKAIVALPTMPDPSPALARNGAFGEWLAIYRHINHITEPESIYNVPSFGARKIGELEGIGVTTLSEIPPEVSLPPKLMRLMQAVRQDTRLTDLEALKAFVASVQYPLYFLDYESFADVIPPFDGLRPYQQVPFQYSLHIKASPESPLEHREFLHTSNTHPVRPLLEQMAADIGPHGTILVWHQTFEKGRNIEMAALEPDFNTFLFDVNDRIIDLKTPFSEGWIVDRGFRASNSIKDVLPVFVPELSYKDLNVRGGSTAQRLWMEIVFDNKHQGEREALLEDLRKYCERDTFAMVRIWENLLGLIKEETGSRAFMDALTASDEQHRRAMRGMTPEVAAQLLKNCYNLTDEQAKRAQYLRDVEGMSEDDAVAQVRSAESS